MNKKAFAISELLTTVIILSVIAAVIYLAAGKIRASANINSCKENLKNIAKGLDIYANDYKAYPRSGPPNAFWAGNIGWQYDKAWPDFKTKQWNGKPLGASVSSCWYLLIRYCQMYPYQFICKSSSDKEFTHFSMIADFRQIWDFGDVPYNSCSYGMQNPFGKFPAKLNSDADKPIAADKSAWFDRQNNITKAAPNNSKNHSLKGQNVLFGDYHINFEKTQFCGIDSDGIYNFGQNNNPPTDRNTDNDAQNQQDSFIVF